MSLSLTNSDMTRGMSGSICPWLLGLFSIATLFKRARVVVEFSHIFSRRKQLKLRSAVAELAGTTISKLASFTVFLKHHAHFRWLVKSSVYCLHQRRDIFKLWH